MNAKLTIVNFKKLQELEVAFEAGNLYFIKGKNGVGKTSFLQALLELLQQKKANKDKLTIGEKSGYVTGVFNLTGGDDEIYTIKMNYTEKTENFTIVFPDGRTSKRKTDIAGIFNYSHFTIEEFFGWGLTKDGQRKQAEILLKLLSQEDQERIVQIDEQIDGTKGVLFLRRRDKNAEVKGAEFGMKNNKLSIEQNRIAKEATQWVEDLRQMEEEYNGLKKANEGIEGKKQQIESLKEAEENNNGWARDEEGKLKAGLSEIEEERLELQEKLKKLAQKEERLRQDCDANIERYNQTAEDCKKQWMEIEKNMPEGAENFEQLEKDIEDSRAAVEEAQEILTKKANYEQFESTYEQLSDEAQKMTDDIEGMRDEKRAIIEKIEGMPNLVIDDGMLYLDVGGHNLPFNEDNISYAEGGMIVFKLMTLINKDLPLWLIGKAREYDDEKIDEFANIAKQKGGIVIADYVDPETDEFEILVKDDTNDNGKRKTLF